MPAIKIISKIDLTSNFGFFGLCLDKNKIRCVKVLHNCSAEIYCGSNRIKSFKIEIDILNDIENNKIKDNSHLMDYEVDPELKFKGLLYSRIKNKYLVTIYDK